jgi:hypothetical protein
MLSASTSDARAAVSYNIRHSVFSRSGASRRDNARPSGARPTARVASVGSRHCSTPAGSAWPRIRFRAHQRSQEVTPRRPMGQGAHPIDDGGKRLLAG